MIKTLQINADYILIFNVGINETLLNHRIEKEALVLLEWPVDIISAPNSYWKYVVSAGLPLWWLNDEVKVMMEAAFNRWV